MEVKGVTVCVIFHTLHFIPGEQRKQTASVCRALHHFSRTRSDSGLIERSVKSCCVRTSTRAEKALAMKKRNMGNTSIGGSLAYLCSLLNPFGLHALSPQSLLLAAANHPSASASIWPSLHQLICLQLASPSSSSPVDNVLSSTPQRDDILPDDIISFVKFYLSLWGYSHTSPIFSLSYDTEESHHLLLALAWLISKCDIFKRALKTKLSKLSPPRSPPTAAHVSSTSTAVERGRQARQRSQEYVDKLIAASDNLEDDGLSARARSQQALMLYGRVRMSMMTLHALISTTAKRTHDLNQMQLEFKIKNQEGCCHSQFDVLLLRDKEALDKHFGALEALKHIGEEMVQCEKHEKTFWQWMIAVFLHRDVERLPVVAPPSQKKEKLKVILEFCSVCLPPVLKYLRQKSANEEKSVICPSDFTIAEALAQESITDLKEFSRLDDDSEGVSRLLENVHSRFHEFVFVSESSPPGSQHPATNSDAESIVERFVLLFPSKIRMFEVAQGQCSSIPRTIVLTQIAQLRVRALTAYKKADRHFTLCVNFLAWYSSVL